MQADGKEAHCTDDGQPLSEQPDKVLDEIPDKSSLQDHSTHSLRVQSVVAGKSRDSARASWSHCIHSQEEQNNE